MENCWAEVYQRIEAQDRHDPECSRQGRHVPAVPFSLEWSVVSTPRLTHIIVPLGEFQASLLCRGMLPGSRVVA